MTEIELEPERSEQSPRAEELSPAAKAYLRRAETFAGADAAAGAADTAAVGARERRVARTWAKVEAQLAFADDPVVNDAKSTAPIHPSSIPASGKRARASRARPGVSVDRVRGRWIPLLWGWGLGVAMGIAATLFVGSRAGHNAAMVSLDAEPRPASPSSARSADAPSSAAAAATAVEPVATAQAAPVQSHVPSDTSERPSAAALEQASSRSEPGGSTKTRSSLPTLEAEVTSLDQVFRLLDVGEPKQALELLRMHRSTFPRPVLRQEAEAAQVIGRCLTRPGEESWRAAATFGKHLGQSPLRERVRRACESTPAVNSAGRPGASLPNAVSPSATHRGQKEQ